MEDLLVVLICVSLVLMVLGFISSIRFVINGHNNRYRPSVFWEAALIVAIIVNIIAYFLK